MRRRPPPAFQGFTLVELLVVLALMGLLIGLVPTALERMREGSHYRDTLRAVASGLRSARQQALQSRSETRFHIDLAQRSFGLAGASGHTLPEPLQMRATVASAEMHGQDAAIRFFADGGSTGGSIEIVRPSGTGTRLQVDWLSGRVTQEALLP